MREQTGHSSSTRAHERELSRDWPRATQPHGSAAAAEGALLHATARLPTALRPIAATLLVRLENSTPDVAAGAVALTPEKRSPGKGIKRLSARADRTRPIDSRFAWHFPQSYIEKCRSRASARRHVASNACWEQTPETHALTEFLLCMGARVALTYARVVVACYRSSIGRTDMLSGRPTKQEASHCCRYCRSRAASPACDSFIWQPRSLGYSCTLYTCMCPLSCTEGSH